MQEEGKTHAENNNSNDRQGNRRLRAQFMEFGRNLVNALNQFQYNSEDEDGMEQLW